VREVVGAAEVVFSHEALVLEAEVDDEEPVVPGIVDGVVKLPETDGVWDSEVDVLVDHTPHPPVIDGTAFGPLLIATRFVPQLAALARWRL
jgi:hypothetical protein